MDSTLFKQYLLAGCFILGTLLPVFAFLLKPRKKVFSPESRKRFRQVCDAKRLVLFHKTRRSIPPFEGHVFKRLETILGDLRPALAQIRTIETALRAASLHWLESVPSQSSSTVSQSSSSLSFILVDDKSNPVVWSSSPEINCTPSPPIAEENLKACLVAIKIGLVQLMSLMRADLSNFEEKHEVASAVDEIVQLHLSLILKQPTLQALILIFLADSLRFLDTFLSVHTFVLIVSSCKNANGDPNKEALYAICASVFPAFMPGSEIVDEVLCESPFNYSLCSLFADSRYSAKYLLSLYSRAAKSSPPDYDMCLFVAKKRLQSIYKRK